VSARSKARKQALDLLYETDIRGTNLVETLEARDIPAEGPDARPIREYTRELVKGVSENRRKIDELITTYAGLGYGSIASCRSQYFAFGYL